MIRNVVYAIPEAVLWIMLVFNGMEVIWSFCDPGSPASDYAPVYTGYAIASAIGLMLCGIRRSLTASGRSR